MKISNRKRTKIDPKEMHTCIVEEYWATPNNLEKQRELSVTGKIALRDYNADYDNEFRKLYGKTVDNLQVRYRKKSQVETLSRKLEEVMLQAIENCYVTKEGGGPVVFEWDLEDDEGNIVPLTPENWKKFVKNELDKIQKNQIMTEFTDIENYRFPVEETLTYEDGVEAGNELGSLSTGK